MDIFTQCVGDSSNTGGSEVRLNGNGRTLTIHLEDPYRAVEIDTRELQAAMHLFSRISRTSVAQELE
jgi:hypothetical protein